MPLDAAGQILRRAPLIDPNLSGPLALQAAGDYERLSYQGRLSTAVVHLICNQGVTGSNPVAGTRLSLLIPSSRQGFIPSFVLLTFFKL